MIYRQGDEYQGQPAPFDIYEGEDLRGLTVELVCPQNTQFIGCTFSDEDGGNQATIIANGYGREYLGCVGTPIEVGG